MSELISCFYLKYSEWIEPLKVAIPKTVTREMKKQAIKTHAAADPFNRKKRRRCRYAANSRQVISDQVSVGSHPQKRPQD